MKNMNEGSASYLYVGNVASTAADAADISTIAAGSVAFCTEDNKVEKTATPGTVLRIAQKLADGTMIFSPFFDSSILKDKVGASYVASSNQVTYVGFNGTAGALDATADKYFAIDTEWLNTMGNWNPTPFRFPIGYKTVAASQSELALGLVNHGIATMSRQPFKFIQIEAVSDGTEADWTGVASSMTVVRDSNYVTYTNGSGVAAAGEALVDGSYVFIAGATYKVEGTGTTAGFYLSEPYQGVSAELTGGTTYATQCGLITAITNWGVKMTGQDNPSFNPRNDNYETTKFKVYIADTFVTATETTTEAVDSNTEVKNIAQQEVYSQFLDKDCVNSAYPQTEFRSEVSLSNTYDICSFNIQETSNVSASTGMPTIKTFAIKVATKVSLTGDDIDTVLGVTV